MRITVLFIAFALAGCMALAQVGGQPTVVPIQNPSFESSAPRYEIPGWTTTVNLPGWQALVIQPKSPSFSPAPDGNNVAYVGNSTISQDLGVKASDLQIGHGSRDGVYTLTFYTENYFYNYPGYYGAKINIGKHELCSTDGWATRKWEKITLACPAPDYLIFGQWVSPDSNPELSHPDSINISISASGWQLLFDDVSLTFTPQ